MGCGRRWGGGEIIPGPRWSLSPQGLGGLVGPGGGPGPWETMPLRASGTGQGICAPWCVVRTPPLLSNPRSLAAAPPQACAHQTGRLWRRLWRQQPQHQVRLLGTQRGLRAGLSVGPSPSMPSLSWGFNSPTTPPGTPTPPRPPTSPRAPGTPAPVERGDRKSVV